MKSNKLDWSKSKIIVDKNGAIMNGHHRIIAAQKAKVQIPDSAIVIFRGENLRPIYNWAGQLK